MHNGKLTGHVTGKNRQQLIDTATKQATEYFAPEAPYTIEIAFKNEQTITVEENDYGTPHTIQTVVGFEADYTASLKNEAQP